MKLVNKILKEGDLFKPRKIDSREEERVKQLNLILNQKIIEGNFNTVEYKDIIIDLGQIEFIQGCLDLSHCKDLISLGNLKKVNGNAYCWFCESLTTLGNLEYVGETLRLYGCRNLTSLGNLKYVKEKIGLHSCYKLESIGDLELHIHNTIHINNNTNKLVINDIKRKFPRVKIIKH